MSHYQQFQLQTSTAQDETDDSFKFLLAANRDLFAIKRTVNGADIFILSAASNYSQFIQGFPNRPLPGGTIEFLLASNRDIFAIRRTVTGADILILSATSNYSPQLISRSQTPSLTRGATFDFQLAPNRDLFAIQKDNTASGKTEIYVLANGNYKKKVLPIVTSFPKTDATYKFLVAPNRDLFVIQKSNTRSHCTEITILSAASNYQDTILHTGTLLHETDKTFEFQLTSNLDLFVISKKNTASHVTEVHVLLNKFIPNTASFTEYNVKNFGAVGDGETDDSPAFDAALAAMQNPGSSRGNKLIIPTGTFRLTHELFIECDCIIEGSGVGQESSGTILYFDPIGANGFIGCHGVILNSGRGSTTGRNAGWTLIRDLSIQARSWDQEWLRRQNLKALVNRNGFIARTRFKLENVNIFNFTGNGVHIVTGDGNNSDGRALWKPNTQYTVGDYVMEPGFPRHLLTSAMGSIAATFNPQGSGDISNIYTLQITRNNANWDNPPIIGDTFIIPADTLLAGTDNDNAGAYIVLGPKQKALEPSSTSFWAEKYADDPYISSNGITKNPVSIGETRLNYTGSGVHTINVRGESSGATATIPANGDHGTYIVITGATGVFRDGETLVFGTGTNGIANRSQYPAVDILSINDAQVFSRPQNRYGATTSGKSSASPLAEGPGEVRLNYYKPNITGDIVGGTVTGSESGARADVIRDSGLYVAITGSTKAFLNDEILTFARVLGGVVGVVGTASSGQVSLNYKMNPGMPGGTHIGDTIHIGSNARGFVTADDGATLIFTPIPNSPDIQNGAIISFQAGVFATAQSKQATIAGTQYHSATAGYAAVDYTSSGKTHTGGVVHGKVSGAEGIIGDDTGSTIIFTPTNGFKFIDGEELIFSVINPEISSAASNQIVPPALSDGPGGEIKWYSQGSDMGNANNWLVEYCRVAGCGGHGMFIQGDNVNAGTSIGFDASGNGGWGIYDSSFLGNTHIGAHTEYNALGPYLTSLGGNAHNVFIGCYSEGDSPPSKIYNPSISLGGIMAAGFAADSSGFRLDASWEGPEMSSHFVRKFYKGKAIKTTIGRASEGAQIFAGIEFTHTDDHVGFLMGGYNHDSGSWTFGKTNYNPSFEVLGGIHSNVFRPSSGLVIPAGAGTRAGVPPGVFILAYNGYPLVGNQGSNSFYPGTLILNQNADNDQAKGWICTQKCGSGRAWSKWENIRDPYYAGSTITPSIPNGFVYRAAIAGPAHGGDTEPVWATDLAQTPPVPIVDGHMIWELFGYTDRGLEEIVTREANTTPVIPMGINITSGEDLDITRHPFQKFGLIKIISGKIGVKFSIMRPIHSGVTYYVLCTVQTSNSKLTSVIANAHDDPDDSDKIIITIIGNSKADISTDVCWLLKWSQLT